MNNVTTNKSLFSKPNLCIPSFPMDTSEQGEAGIREIEDSKHREETTNSNFYRHAHTITRAHAHSESKIHDWCTFVSTLWESTTVSDDLGRPRRRIEVARRKRAKESTCGYLRRTHILREICEGFFSPPVPERRS